MSTSTKIVSTTDWDYYRSFVPKGQDPDETHSRDIHEYRDSIIVTYLALCERVVNSLKRSMPSHVEKDDLESHAKIGLMQAVTRFDHTLGVPFEAFATQRMYSVIKDAVREADWAPRSLRKKQRDITKVTESWRQKHGATPSNEQVAEELGISVDDVADTHYRASISTHTYIDSSVEAQNKPASLNDTEDELVIALKHAVASALSTMAVRKAAIISMHYYDETKLSDIAKALNMSEVKVGALHAEAVLEIWERIQNVLADA